MQAVRKSLTYGQRIALGWGFILLFLFIAAVLNFAGVADLVRSADDTIAGSKLDRDLAQKEIDHLNWITVLNNFLSDRKAAGLQIETDDHKCGFGQWLYGEGRQKAEERVPSLAPLFKGIEVPHHNLHESAAKIAAAKTRDEAEQIYTNETLPALRLVQAQLHTIRTEAQRHILSEDVMLSSARNLRNYMLPLGLGAIGLGSLLFFFIIRSITKRIARILGNAIEGWAEVIKVSRQMSSFNLMLASGVSEQAASLEETAAALEETASQTNSNAANAREASRLAQDTKGITESCASSMQKMAASIGQVDEASQETRKIVKTIDEIAFQTNLLALNAAVEAARAGEAGAGFAVVAEEVRNLAMRAADAAHNTTEQIQNISTKINDAMEMVLNSIDEFGQVDENSAKVSTLMGEIAVASQEQAQGIEQINGTVSAMDRSVQQNATNADGSAAASQALNVQVQLMEGVIRELFALLIGNNKAKADESVSKRTSLG